MFNERPASMWIWQNILRNVVLNSGEWINSYQLVLGPPKPKSPVEFNANTPNSIPMASKRNRKKERIFLEFEIHFNCAVSVCTMLNILILIDLGEKWWSGVTKSLRTMREWMGMKQMKTKQYSLCVFLGLLYVYNFDWITSKALIKFEITSFRLKGQGTKSVLYAYCIFEWIVFCCSRETA